MSGGATEDGKVAVPLLSRNASCSETWIQRVRHQVHPAVCFDSALMVPNLRSQGRMGAIKELVDRMHSTGCVVDSLNFLQSVLDRENLESTVAGPGIAFPHARCRSATRLGVAFGVSRDGVDFHTAPYPYRVHMICLLAVPASGDGGYLPLLGMLTGALQDQTFRTGLMACRTSDEMYRYLYPSFWEEYVDKTPYLVGK